MSNVKISVVVPVYNAENTLSKCISSICAQDMKEIEVLCIDDCSRDSSLSLLKEMAEDDKRIVVLHNENNEGTLRARKRGVEAAQGEYIMFADNDDWYEPNCFNDLYTKAKEKQTDILMYGFRPVKVSHEDNQEIIEEQVIWFAVPEEELFEGNHCLTIKNRINLLWNKIIKAETCKEAYANTEDVFLTIAEDTYACMLIHYFAKSFAAVTDIYYNWNCADGVSNNSEISLQHYYTACECMGRYEKAFSEFLKKRGEDELLNAFENKEKEVGYDFCIDMWRKTVLDENADELKKVIGVYGEKKVYAYIHKMWNQLEDKCRDMGTEIDRLYDVEKYLHGIIDRLEDRNSRLKNQNSELKQKVAEKNEKIKKLKSDIQRLKASNEALKNSTSYKVGKAVTLVPRKLKKGFDE